MNQKQNAEIETRAALAAKGGGYNWNSTPIEVTEAAKQTDPARIQASGGPSSGCGWWSHAEPAFFKAQGESLKSLLNRALRKFGRDDRDERSGKERENRYGDEEKRAEADDAERFEEYLPEGAEDAHEWLAALATKVDVTRSPAREWFDALTRYVDSFGAAVRARELDAAKIRKYVQKICEGGSL